MMASTRGEIRIERNAGAPLGRGKLQVGLAGCGTVGAAFLRLLAERRPQLAARGLEPDVRSVLVREPERHMQRGLSSAVLTTCTQELLDAGTGVVVEATGSVATGERLARAVLARGGHFVTANKALVAAAGAELQALAVAHGGRFSFEAAVGGGVPVVRAVGQLLRETEVLSVRGILNGTTNYLLDAMRSGAAYGDALRDAQEAGYAEADPTRDVDGRDAAAKVAILAWLAFGMDPAAVRVRTRGILPHPQRLVAEAEALGGVVRLLAGVRPGQGGLDAWVEPALLDPAAPLAAVRGADNGVEIATRWCGTVRLGGPGAGGEATASALLADVLLGPADPAPLPTPTLPAGTAGTAVKPPSWVLALRRQGAAEAFLGATLRRVGLRGRVVLKDGRRLTARIEAAPPGTVELVRRALEARALEPVLLRDLAGGGW